MPHPAPAPKVAPKTKPAAQRQDGESQVPGDNAPVVDDADVPDVVPTLAEQAALVQEMLDLHGVEVVEVSGTDTNSSLANAIAATLHPVMADLESQQARQALEARQALVNRFEGMSSPEDITREANARVHVLGTDGKFRSFGPVAGWPVHVVEVKESDGGVRFSATREIVHIGRPGVSYPGSTKQLTNDGKTKAVHRAEFEIETIAGRHHVRIYTAVMNPVNLQEAAGFKDIQQDPVSGELKFASGSGSYLWAGAGRPMRALQWLRKYELEVTKPGSPVPDLRPVLRSSWCRWTPSTRSRARRFTRTRSPVRRTNAPSTSTRALNPTSSASVSTTSGLWPSTRCRGR